MTTDDYFRRHKDAGDCCEQVLMLRQEIAAIEAELAQQKSLVAELCTVRDRLKYETDYLRFERIELIEERDHLRAAIAPQEQPRG